VAGIKYYKGLGTSTAQEAKAYFADLARHTVRMRHTGEPCSEAIRTFFSKHRVEARRELLREVDEDACVDYAADEVTVRDFCHREVVHFSHADLQRSVPSMVDGLKPSQRKLLFAALQRPGVEEKVEHFAAHAAKLTQYHHGSNSLESATVGMAQDFWCTNHVNLLLPVGQFGNRHGERAASARYIFTKLNPLARKLFPAEDDAVLERLEDEGAQIEPRFYVPVVPLVLLNGADGIGTGWMTHVPSYAPDDVLARCRRMAAEEEEEEETGEEGDKPTSAALVPSPRGFTGGVDMAEDGRSVVYSGACCVEEEGEEAEEGRHNNGATQKPVVVRITELPPRAKTNDVKAALQELAGVSEVVPNNGEDTVDVRVLFHPGCAPATAQERTKLLKLTAKESLRNMNLFSAEGRLEHYDAAEEIVRAHAAVRLATYERRLRAQVREAESKLDKCRAMQRLIGRVVDGTVDPIRMRKDEVVRALDGDEAGAALLRAASVSAMTPEGVEARREEEARLMDELERCRRATPRGEWRRELDALQAALDADRREREERREAEEAERRATQAAQQAEKATKGKRRAGGGQAAGGRRKADKAARTAKAAETTAGGDGGGGGGDVRRYFASSAQAMDVEEAEEAEDSASASIH
jgi:DNA topoisomerase-2